jgi:hypothetical protein
MAVTATHTVRCVVIGYEEEWAACEEHANVATNAGYSSDYHMESDTERADAPCEYCEMEG